MVLDTRKTAKDADKNPKNPLVNDVKNKLDDIFEEENSSSAEMSRIGDSDNEQTSGTGETSTSQSTPIPPPEESVKSKTKNLTKETRYNKMKNKKK